MGKKQTGKSIEKGTKKSQRHPGGRPSKYSDALVQKICERLSAGESLRAICRDAKMPVLSTVLLWLNDQQHKDFVDMYNQAREVQADLMFEEIREIADDAAGDMIETEYVNKKGDKKKMKQASAVPILRARLRIDARKWTVARMAPKKYGDRIDVTSGGKPIKEPRKVAINYVVPQETKTK